MPDLLAGRIIREQITPAFKAGDFAGGLNPAVDAIGQAIAGEGLPAPAPRTAGHAARRGRAASTSRTWRSSCSSACLFSAAS